MKRKIMFLLTLLFVGISVVNAQARKVTGHVYSSEDNEPIVGATILVVGTTQGTITGIDGDFVLGNVPESATTLRVSYVGMKSKDVKIKPVLEIYLDSDAELLDEVVVTAMGQSREKKALGYAATSVGGEEIAEAQVVNPMDALKGKVAGVDISAAPSPGGTQNVLIRGVSSFGSNQPLYIVDGVPITNVQDRSGDNLNSGSDFGSGINAINPDDIKNMTVLKGAAATALYGSRAANGVIMITTKSGENTKGKIRVNYSGSMTLSQVGRLPEMQDTYGQGWSGDHALPENGSWGPAFDGKERVWGNIVGSDQQVKPYSFVDDNIRSFYDTGKTYKNAVSLSGGDEKNNFYLSLSHNSTNGVYPGDVDTYERYTISAKGETKGEKWKIGASANFSIEDTKTVPTGQGSSTFRSLLEIANDISISELKDYNNKFNTLENYFTLYGLNPYYVLDNDGAKQNKNKIFGKFEASYDILDNLTVQYKFGGDYESSTAESWIAKKQAAAGSYNYGTSGMSAGSYSEIRRERTQTNHDLIAMYKENLNEDFTINAIAGFNLHQRTYSYLTGGISSIDVPGFYNLGNSLSPSTASQYKSIRRLMGLYANVDFSYKNYAYLTLTARNDWSSTLPLNDNSFFYPGITGSFLITDFLKERDIDPGVLSYAKVRAAYGMTGNDASLYYVYDRFVSGSSSNPGYPDVDDLTFPLGGVNSYSVSNQLGSKDLKAELTKEFEFGVEAKFFDSRVGFDFSYYNRLTEGLLNILPMDPSTGYTSKLANIGDVRNKGIELVVDVTPIKTKDFQWDLSWNFSKNWNKVEKLDVDEVYLSGFGGMGIYAVEGKSIGQFKTAGIKKWKDESGVEHIVVNGDGMPIENGNDEFVGKDVNEKYRMGLNTSIRYKDFTLAANFDYRYGGYMYSYTMDYLAWTGGGPETMDNNRLTFLVPGSVYEKEPGVYVENTTPVDPTAYHTYYKTNGMQGAEAALIDRSYLKLRQVSLSWSVPSMWCKKLKVNNIRLSASANNILLWTPKDNLYIDPETTTFGNDIDAKFGEFGAGPTNESYTFGLSFGF